MSRFILLLEGNVYDLRKTEQLIIIGAEREIFARGPARRNLTQLRLMINNPGYFPDELSFWYMHDSDMEDFEFHGRMTTTMFFRWYGVSRASRCA